MAAHRIAVLAVFPVLTLAVVLPVAGCSDKKAVVVVDAGAEEAPAPAGPDDKADPAKVKASIAASCGEADMCACMNERFHGRYSDAAVGVMTNAAVNVAVDDAREDCKLRTGKLREGVLTTCMDGKEEARQACECATDSFLRITSSSELREILAKGWDRDTTNVLALERRTCAKKLRAR